MQALFDEVSLSSLVSNITTILIAFIGISLLFTGFRYIRRVIKGEPEHIEL